MKEQIQCCGACYWLSNSGGGWFPSPLPGPTQADCEALDACAAGGFERVEVRPLHPATSPLEGVRGAEVAIELVERALYGPQDYAVLGYKINPVE